MNRLINRNTGEIVTYGEGIIDLKMLGCKNVAEMIEAGWEEYKPKQSALRVMILTLTNFIENEPTGDVDLEDCKQMLEKLKAWKRLKDAGFKFTDWRRDDVYGVSIQTNELHDCGTMGMIDELNLLFGGE